MKPLDFDKVFQAKIVRLLYQDDGFAAAAVDHLKAELFSNPAHRWVVKKVAWCHQALGHHITRTILVQEWHKDLKLGLINADQYPLFREFLAKQIVQPVPDKTYIKSEVQQFIKNQHLEQFLLWVAEDGLPGHKFEEIDKRMADLAELDVTGSNSVGSFFGKTFKERKLGRKNDASPGYTTGLPGLDSLMTNGGLEPGQLGSVLGATGRGKCLGLGTPVLRYDGSVVNAEDVKTGDLLMGPDSRPRHVLSTTRGTGGLFKITPVKGAPWVCNDVHVLSVQDTVTGVVTDIPLDQYLSKGKTFKHRNKQYFTGVDFPTATALPVDPYFMGLWFGDGTKDLRVIEVTKPDPEVKRCCDEVAAAWGLRVSTYAYAYAASPRHRLVGHDKLRGAIRTLVGEGINVPQTYLTSSKADRASFLSGWLDSDGHLHDGGYDFIQKRKDYASAVVFLARSLGLQAVMVPCQKSCQGGFTGNYYRVSISGDCSFLPMRLPRKKAPPRKQKKVVTRTGFSVSGIGVGEYAGFTLDGDGRFLLGDFTVTHNTNTLINIAASNVLEGIPTVYYTCELPQSVIETRMDARFTGIPIRLLKTNTNEYDKQWESLEGCIGPNLVVKEYPMGTLTVSMIRAHLKQLERHGFYPKVLVIDYADVMCSSTVFADSSYETQGQIYKDLKGLAMALKLAIWTGTQTNRAGMSNDDSDVDLAKIADSAKKAFIADLVLGLNQTTKEKASGMMRVSVLKNRNGPAEREVLVKVDHAVCRFLERSRSTAVAAVPPKVKPKKLTEKHAEIQSKLKENTVEAS